MKYTDCKTIDEYLNQSSEPAKSRMIQIRKLVNEMVPDAAESISYHMPTFKTFGKPLIYFGVHSHHIGFYALPSGHDAFKAELAEYKGGKGSVQFPFDKPLPIELIKQLISFRKQENEEKYAHKKSR